MRSELYYMNECKKLGIMGGTFDPIHNGHLKIAELALKNYNLDKVVFIPSGSPNFKQEKLITNKNYRLEMIKIAIKDNPNFLVSSLEVDKNGITYSYDTINTLKKLLNKDVSLYFIIGADNALDILNWHNGLKLIKQCNFIVFNRPGTQNLESAITILNKNYSANFSLMQIDEINISSTLIRSNIEQNIEIEKFVPSDLTRYIKENYLYNYKSFINLIKSSTESILSEYRFLHTQNVAKVAIELAKIHKVNPKKAEIAAYLHDYAKEISKEEALNFCDKRNLFLDSMLRSKISLAHGMIGSVMAFEYFGIDDIDILNAIQYHTTGRKNMSDLEKIIYLSDCIEPSRPNFKELEKIRLSTYIDLNKAMLYALNMSKRLNSKKGFTVHKKTIEAINYFKKLEA